MKPLCYAPFVSIVSDTRNYYAPCCVSTRRFSFDTIQQYWDSEELIDIRNKLLNQQWPKECSSCEQEVKNGISSEAAFYDHLYEKFDLKIGTPQIIDYRVSNKCNLKCRMCAPGGSNLISKEVDDNPELREFYPHHEDSYYNDNQILSFVSKDTKKLKILGGEPSIDPKVLALLNSLIDKDLTDINLIIVTNATNHNDKFYSTLDKFSNVSIKLSVDAAGGTYEYIRTNADWENVKKYSEQIIKSNKYKSCLIASVVMAFNAFSMVTLLEWFEEMYYKGWRFGTSFQPNVFDTSSLSSLYDEDISYIVSELNLWSANKSNELLKAIDFQRLMELIVNTKHNPQHLKKFISYAGALDRIRGTNICNIDDRFKKYF